MPDGAYEGRVNTSVHFNSNTSLPVIIPAPLTTHHHIHNVNSPCNVLTDILRPIANSPTNDSSPSGPPHQNPPPPNAPPRSTSLTCYSGFTTPRPLSRSFEDYPEDEIPQIYSIKRYSLGRNGVSIDLLVIYDELYPQVFYRFNMGNSLYASYHRSIRLASITNLRMASHFFLCSIYPCR